MFFYTENMEAAGVWGVLGYVHYNALHYNLSDILENQMLPDDAFFMDKITINQRLSEKKAQNPFKAI